MAKINYLKLSVPAGMARKYPPLLFYRLLVGVGLYDPTLEG